MAVRHLKTAKPESERAEDDAKVRATVEGILADIAARGDAAVRELAEKFDGYAPASFRLSPSEIEAAMQKVAPATWRTSASRRPRSAASPKRSGPR
jgi:sulfopropanediol 3-dehydrogenase